MVPSFAGLSKLSFLGFTCVIWLSSPEAAKTEESCGHHSTEVIGPEWCLNCATAFFSWRRLKSQTFITPSSPPDTMNGSFLFQLIENDFKFEDDSDEIGRLTWLH